MPRPVITLKFKEDKFLFNQTDLDRVFEALGGCLAVRCIEASHNAIAMMNSFESCLTAIEAIDGRTISNAGKTDSIVAEMTPNTA